jgi:chromate reductase, NAD(P)H dehydrogenase (quinone)
LKNSRTHNLCSSDATSQEIYEQNLLAFYDALKRNARSACSPLPKARQSFIRVADNTGQRAKALVRLAPAELEMGEISFKDLPLYSYDYDADFPPVAKAFKNAIAAVDAVLFVTPEYNRSIPGGLKNAIDWASRPYGQNSFARKPSAVIGTSPGAIGTAVAQQSLRSVLSFCNSPQMNAPEAYIQFKSGLITDDGEVTNEGTETFLRNYMAEFGVFVARVLSVLPKNA